MGICVCVGCLRVYVYMWVYKHLWVFAYVCGGGACVWVCVNLCVCCSETSSSLAPLWPFHGFPHPQPTGCKGQSSPPSSGKKEEAQGDEHWENWSSSHLEEGNNR